MFSLFKKSPPAPAVKVWKSRPVMLSGMVTEALRVVQTSGKAVLVTWFEEDHRNLSGFLADNKVPVAKPGDANQTGIHVYTSRELLTGITHHGETGRISFFFDGHYPLIQKENELLEKLTTPGNKELTIAFYLSLDRPIFKHFGGDRLIEMLDKLGFKDDECLENPMISKSLQRAREKLSSQVTTEMLAGSEAEWFSRNVPA